MEINIITENTTELVKQATDKLFSNIAIIDIIACFLLTIPILLAFVIVCIIYFKKIDKKVDSKTHGLSRFALGGVLMLFGMILVDMNVEFVSAMIISLNKANKLNLESLKPLIDSVFFTNFVERYRSIPFDILVMGNIFCTALYAGAEGLVSSFKTLSVPEGMCIELPLIKKKRIKFIFLVWCGIAILATIYTIIIGSEEIQFEVALSYTGVISTLIILILADRSPTILQNFTSNKTVSKTVNMSSSTASIHIESVDGEDKKQDEDAIDHLSDAAVKILKKLNPELDKTESNKNDNEEIHQPTATGGDL